MTRDAGRGTRDAVLPEADHDVGAERVPETMHVIDSHTEGEPTRVIVDGFPQPQGATMGERRDDMRARLDHLRRAVVCEPRGHAAIVGALLTPPVEVGSVTGVVFFNNETYLGMCGHGLIGVVRTLEYLGRIGPGVWRFDTPVGTVAAELDDDGAVTIENVPAFCFRRNVRVDVPDLGEVLGDIAYGGNWFFITELDGVRVSLDNAAVLTRLTRNIQEALRARGITGAHGADIDHIEISAVAGRPDADCRNFVLCSGGAYDRSPCGTGTSAKMAVLHSRGELKLDEPFRQEGVTGSMFTGWLTSGIAGDLIPHIRGNAYVTGDATLRFDPADPFRTGFPGA